VPDGLSRTQLVLYVAAGIVGELVGLEWQPHGAGNSVAAFGLAGALAVDALCRRETSLLALGYAVVVLVILGAGDLGDVAGTVIVVVAYVAAGASVAATRRGTNVPPWGAPALGVATLVVAVVLVALENIHGPALLTGVAVALICDLLALRDRGGARTARRRRRGSGGGGRRSRSSSRASRRALGDEGDAAPGLQPEGGGGGFAVERE
jgi:hypothetical protein